MRADDISIDPLAVEAAVQRLQQSGNAGDAAESVAAIREMFQRATVRSSNAFGRVAMMGCVKGMCEILDDLGKKLQKEAPLANGATPSPKKRATARKITKQKKAPKRARR